MAGKSTLPAGWRLWPERDAAEGTSAPTVSGPWRGLGLRDWAVRFVRDEDVAALVRTSWPYAPHVGAVPRIGRGL